MDAPVEETLVADDETDAVPAKPVTGVRLTDLRRRHCRCVVGHDGFLAMFCGEPIVSETSSWCAEHYAQFKRTKVASWEKAAVKYKKEK